MIPTSRSLLRILCLGLAMAGLASANANSTFGQDPNGGHWHPLSTVGTYIYSNSFTAQASGDVLSLGGWLRPQVTDASTWVKFQILGSSGGDVGNGKVEVVESHVSLR